MLTRYTSSILTSIRPFGVLHIVSSNTVQFCDFFIFYYYCPVKIGYPIKIKDSVSLSVSKANLPQTHSVKHYPNHTIIKVAAVLPW